MASPVDTSVKWARSTMPGAPVLRGQAGSLISLLDAVLVDGWGSQTASAVTISGGVATATFPSDHAAAVEAVVLVAGATPAGLNGEQKVIAVEPNKIKWATALPDGTGTGTITVKMAPAGWAKVFTGANLAVYKSEDPQAHGQFLRVNDAGTTAARVVGYENMTAVSTGTGPFPTNTQANGGLYWGKSDAAGSLAIPWSIAADSRAFYYNAAVALPSSNLYTSGTAYFFGDLLPHSRAGDPFATLIVGGPDAGWVNYGGQTMWGTQNASLVALPKKHDGVGTAIQPNHGPYITFALGLLPNPVNGRIAYSPIYVRDTPSQSAFRADAPGALLSSHFGVELVLSPDQIMRDAGGRARLSMLVSSGGIHNTYNFYSLAIDVTGPWR